MKYTYLIPIILFSFVFISGCTTDEYLLSYNTTYINSTINNTILNGDGTGGWINNSFNTTTSLNVNVNTVSFNTSFTPSTHYAGQIHWDITDGTLDYDSEFNGTHIQIGQESVVKVVNKAGINLVDGLAVYISGSQGNRPKVDLASNNDYNKSYKTLGIVTMPIAINQEGLITTFGLVRDIKTSQWNAGDILYVDINGNLTNVLPKAPNNIIEVGFVLNSHPTQGNIFVTIENSFKLSELNDVNSSLANISGQFLVWDNLAKIYQLKDLNSLNRNITFNNINNQPLIFSGNSTIWDDFNVQGNVLTSGAFAPTLTIINNSATYCYAGTVRNEYSYGSVELNHGWKEGSSLYPHIHSEKISSVLGNYTFRLDYTLADSTHKVNGVTNVTVISNGDVYPSIHSFNNLINASGFGLGSTWSFKITRIQDDPKDNYNDLVCIWQVSSHFESDTLGSASEFGKWN